MDFTQENIYSLDYGVVIKLATFSRKEGEYNFFFDKDGEFALSDSFLSKGIISIKLMNDEL
ncbi:hypothetical protein NBRC13296_12295 [Paenibacillus chitinolyticus]|uniref:hypothetical protein n=1 Tax=Paenibacillus chitinolyticus TaxID=79263 RepID=UPI003558D93C